eukprot:scaffold41353_cov160-Amphora_coffeaeformis.AAC.1
MQKCVNVLLIVSGVALFMGGGNMLKVDSNDAASDGNTGRDHQIKDNNVDPSSFQPMPSSHAVDEEPISPMCQQILATTLLMVSLFFDGGTGAYEDKLMHDYSVEPFDLMFKFKLCQTILSAAAVLGFHQIDLLFEMISQNGF